MDPRRKKIYIVLITVCFGLSAGILLWTFVFNNPDAAVDSSVVVTTPVTRDASGNATEGFLAPSVFPADSDFNIEVLDSEEFTRLNEYPAVDVTDQLGRPDPFMNY